MKKILGIIMCVAMLSACVNEPVSKNQPEENNVENVQQVENKGKKIEREDAAADLEGMTVLGEAMINLDDEIADVYLTTSAEMGNDGYMMWDDSQNWKLVVKDEKGSFTLFDSNVHGKLYIDVTESKEGTAVNLIKISTVGMAVTKYTYKDGAFYSEDVLTAESGGNNIYTSIPDYTK